MDGTPEAVQKALKSISNTARQRCFRQRRPALPKNSLECSRPWPNAKVANKLVEAHESEEFISMVRTSRREIRMPSEHRVSTSATSRIRILFPNGTHQDRHLRCGARGCCGILSSCPSTPMFDHMRTFERLVGRNAVGFRTRHAARRSLLVRDEQRCLGSPTTGRSHARKHA